MELAPLLTTDADAGLTTVNAFITETNSTISDLFNGTADEKTAAKDKIVSILKSASNEFEEWIGYKVVASASDETKKFMALNQSSNWYFPIPIFSFTSSSVTLKGIKPTGTFTVTGKFGLTDDDGKDAFLTESEIRSAVNAIAYKRYKRTIRSQSLGQETETFVGMSWVDSVPTRLQDKYQLPEANIIEIKEYA